MALAEQKSKRLIITVEVPVKDFDELTEDQAVLIGGWVERWPGFEVGRKKIKVETVDVLEIYPCARCGWANSCKRILGEDCHS